jgi:hypothetical protein
MYWLVFYHYRRSGGQSDNDPFGSRPYGIYPVSADALPSAVQLRLDIAAHLGSELQGSAYMVDITGLTQVSEGELKNFLRVDATDPRQTEASTPYQYPGDCAIL